MNEYISSGILEAYALGELSPAEKAEVEQHLAQHPALRDELARIERTMEAMAMDLAIEPGAHVKSSVLESIKDRNKVVNMPPPFWKWAAAASFAAALASSFLAFNYHQRWRESSSALVDLLAQNQRMAQEYNVVNEKLDKIQDDLEIIENSAFSKVVLGGTEGAPEALASVYWNPQSNELYLSIQNLKQLSSANQYQLWAIVDGSPVDLGVFDPGFEGLLQMTSVHKAAAFAVTIEPRGGSVNPSLSTMQVLGSVQQQG